MSSRLTNQIALLTAVQAGNVAVFRAERDDNRPYAQPILDDDWRTDSNFERCEETPTNWNFYKYDYRALPLSSLSPPRPIVDWQEVSREARQLYSEAESCDVGCIKRTIERLTNLLPE